MSARPSVLPRWAWAAAPGGVVNPPSGLAAVGYSTGSKPPAQYFNAMFNQYGAWISFLSGPNTGKWTRRAHNAGASIAMLFAEMDVDGISADTNVHSAFRYGFCNVDSTTGLAAVRVSTRGEEWVIRSNFVAGTGIPMMLKFLPSVANPEGKWWCCTSSVAATIGTLNWTWPDCVAHVGASAIASGGVNWTQQAGWVAGYTHVNDIAGWSGGNKIAVACGRTHGPFTPPDASAAEGIAESFDGGATWSAGVLSVATTHGFTSVACNQGYFVAVTENGEVYTVGSTTGTWTRTLNLASAATGLWRVAAGRLPGEFVLWDQIIHQGTTGPSSVVPRFRFTTDNGATWNVPVTPATLVDVTQMRCIEGVLYATTLQIPFIWESGDYLNWKLCPLPLDETITNTFDAVNGYADWRIQGICYGDSRILCTGPNWTVACEPAMAPSGLGWTPDPVPVVLYDAGYLRGVALNPSPPSVGDTLIYDGTEWVNVPQNLQGDDDARPAAATVYYERDYRATDTETTYRCTGGQWIVASAGNGPDRATSGPISATDYFTGSNSDAEPQMIAGQSLVLMFWPHALPAAGLVLIEYADGMFARGWQLRLGDNAGDRGEFSFKTPAGTVQLTGCTIAGALSQMHTLAIAIEAATGAIHYSLDGAAAANVAAAGAYTAPAPGDNFRIGDSGAGANEWELCALKCYASELTDPNLVAAGSAAGLAAGRIPALGATTVDLAVARLAGGKGYRLPLRFWTAGTSGKIFTLTTSGSLTKWAR